MKSYAAVPLALAATALAAPSGCQESADGEYAISTVNVTSSAKRSLEARQLAGTLMISLENGELMDQAGRTGYIASNYQFQFDQPVQAGARETSGFSLCGNGSLALGDSAVFYQCLSGDFYNLYSQSTGAQCLPIHIVLAAETSGPEASQLPDGQPQASAPVSQISDGQPQATSPGGAISQISDGQPQAPTPGPVISQISDGQPQAPTPGPVISQISDGQPQAPAPTAVISQIPDGQPQAPAPGNYSTPTMSVPEQYTGAAVANNAATGALMAGIAGLLAML